MIIKELSFLNLRKIKTFNEKFLPDTNIIIGPNGFGKTSILEAVFFLSTGKSFRKKYTRAIIKKNEKELKIQAKIFNKKEKTIKLIYSEKKKQFFKNNQIIKTTTRLLQETQIVCVSPEEVDIIEEYKKEKQQYFDKIIFKINSKHIKNMKQYNKVLLYRNTLLENNRPTNPWDKQIIQLGEKIWETRKNFFNTFLNIFNKTKQNLKTKQKHTISYKAKTPKTTKDYLSELKKKTKTNRTEIGPHTDTIELKINNEHIKEHGSQGEKKILKYILKLTEAEIIKVKTKETPIILLDDFFSKLDNENIMKIFLYFHRKFQVIITTTNANDQTLKNIQKNNKKIKILTYK